MNIGTGNGTVNSTLSRGYGTLAGLGFIGAALFAVPSTLLLEPRPPAEDYLVTVGGLFTGLVLMALPWERMDPRWLHAVGPLATVQAAAAVAVFGQVYTAFFFLIAVAVAYMAPDTRGLLAHFAVIGIALFGPVVYGPASPEETIQVGLVVYPLIALTAGIFAYLRQRMVADHRSYQLFAEETLSLAQRIAGNPLPAVEPKAPEEIDLPAWSRLRVSTRVSGVAAAVLAIPLLTTGLAAAGVKLPAVASNAMSEFGIDLPNQEMDQDERSAAPGTNSSGGGGRNSDEEEQRVDASAGAGTGADDSGQDASNNDSAPAGPTAEDQPVTGGPSDEGPGATGSGHGDSPGAQGTGDSDPDDEEPAGLLDETLGGLLDGLGGQKESPDDGAQERIVPPGETPEPPAEEQESVPPLGDPLAE